MFGRTGGKFKEWTFRSALLAACKRRDDGTFVVFPKKSFLFGDGYVLTAEQVPVFEGWYRAALKSAVSPQSIFTRLFGAVAIIVLLSGMYYPFSEPENAPDFIADWPPIADFLFVVGVVAVTLWIVALTRKRAFRLTAKFAESFPFPDAPRIKLGLREQFAMPFRSAVATPGARWVMVLGLILSSIMVLPFVVAVIGVLLALSAGHLSGEHLIDLEMLMMLLTVAVLMFLPALAFISGLGYRRRFFKKTGHPLSMETLYLYETGRLSPGEEGPGSERVITVLGRRLSTSTLSTGLLTGSAIGLAALIAWPIISGVNERLALTHEGWKCIYGSDQSHDKTIAQCTAALDVTDKQSIRVKLFRNRASSHIELDQFEQAVVDLNEALRIGPDDAWTYADRGKAYRGLQDFSAAIRDYQQALALGIDASFMHNELAWLLATAPNAINRNGKKALEHAQRALELMDVSYTRDTLAAVLAELGRFEEAIEQQKIAIDMARTEGLEADIAAFETRLSLYQSGRPLRCPGEACD